MPLTHEQLQERMTALHQVSLELVKDASLETLLKRIVKAACEQAGARYAALGLLDDAGKLVNFISVGMTDDQLKKLKHPPIGRGLIGELMNADAPLRVSKIRDHPKSVGFPRNHPKMGSFLGVPIHAGKRQLGQLYLTDKIGAPEFDANDEMIVQMLAAYASVAIQNTRLLEQMRERDTTLTRRSVDMNFLYGIASALASSLELDEILNRTLQHVMSYLNMEVGEIFLLDEDKSTLRLALHRGDAAEIFWKKNIFRMGEGYPGAVALTRKPMTNKRLTKDTNFVRREVVRAGFQQVACIPLLSGENLMGVMDVATRSAVPLDGRNMEMLMAVATWAGLAIENARLHSNARRLAVLEERDRIGMDLHDGVIQSIYGLGLSLESAINEDAHKAKQRIQGAIDGLNQVIRDLRTYILDLKPRQIGEDGLIGGIQRLIAEFKTHTPIEVTFSYPERGLRKLTESHLLALFHVCQEALANAAKHAKAKSVHVSLWKTEDRVVMEIRDNGVGFVMENTNANIGHGLANMQARVQAVGGDVEITSNINDGTTVLAWVPYHLHA